MDRPTWTSVWMRIARVIAERSVDPRLKVGCVIVDAGNRSMLGLGYNGDEIGGKHAVDSLEPGQSGFVHAEINALIKTRETQGATVYVTHSPCVVCARALVNARVERVIYEVGYRDTRGIEILANAGITVVEAS
jgi:dCMP deaminase